VNAAGFANADVLNGRSGTEAASISGTIYRNVWLANHPRPASLGSALY
jgi:hypothetical protein